MFSDNESSCSKSDHSGHRKRKRRQLIDNGAASAGDADLLEMLLYYAVPRSDTRKTAEAMLTRFGSLEGVINADIRDITEFPGLKENSEVLFSLLKELVARAGKPESIPDLLNPAVLKGFLVDLYRDVSSETVYALYFNAVGELVGRQIIFRGGLNSVRFSLRTLTEGAMEVGGKAVVLAHNHPSDKLVPSNEDVISTKRIAAHLAANDIELIEHYIVGNDDCIGILSVS